MLSASWYRERVRESRGLAAICLRGALRLASFPYGWAVCRRNAAFDAGRREIRRAPVPVVSVGNLTVGGTGKTPLVGWLAGWFDAQGCRVAIVSRGYGAVAGQTNDEARELADKLPHVPHVQHRDRVAAALEAINRHRADILLLDDAFQHRRLHRDLDIVLLDGLDPFGGEYLLPRGLLREPLASLSRADVVVLTRSDLIDCDTREAIRRRVAQCAPRAMWLEAGLSAGELLQVGHPPQSVETLRAKTIAAFCGIGNPAGFRRTLEAAGLRVAAWREFPDHHRDTAADRASLDRWLRSLDGVQAVLCTHKDWVKFDRDTLGDRPLLALAVMMTWRTDASPLLDRLRLLIGKQ